MGRYFDYRDNDLEEICDSLRERINEFKKPIPPKKIKHQISILYKISDNSWRYPYSLLSRRYSYDGKYQEFKSKEEAEKFLNSVGWIKRKGDNCWIEENPKDDGYYEINEYDTEVYEDEETHTEYSEEEKKCLSDALYSIEKARAYIKAYDYCCDQGIFGEGRFSEEVEEELEKFYKNYV